MVRWIYFANAIIAIIIGLSLVIFSPGPFIYGGHEPAKDLVRLFGCALLAVGILTYAVAKSAGVDFQIISTLYFFLGFDILILGFALLNESKEATFELLMAVMGYSFIFAKDDRGLGRTGTRTDWQQSIREEASQQERNRLGQELHDSIKQQLFSIQANLATAQARWDVDAPAVRDAVAHARSSAREAMAEMTAMLDQLQMSPVENIGLREALRRQCDALTFRSGAEVNTNFHDLPPEDSIPAELQNTVFRVAQEALSNIARHARAHHVEVELTSDSTTTELVLLIRDDGQGFGVACPSAGRGLASMRSRAERGGGTIAIKSSPGQGCLVVLRMNPRMQVQDRLKRYRREFGIGLLFSPLLLWIGTRSVLRGPMFTAILVFYAIGLLRSFWNYWQMRIRVVRREA
jgi:signal transduction histidine kinase